MEVEAIDEGTLGKIVIGDGTEGVAVNTVIGVLLEEGEDAAALADSKPSDSGKAPEPETAKPETKAEERAPAAARRAEPGGRSADKAARPEARAKAEDKAAGNGADRGGRIFASPLAKRMAKQAGIDLARLEGSGPHGRIVKADVERAIQAGVPEKARPAPEKARPPAAPARAEAPRPAEAPGVAPPLPSIAPPPSRTRRSSSPTCAR